MTPIERRLLSTITDLDSAMMGYCDGSGSLAELCAQINLTVAVAREALEQVSG